MKKKEKSIFDKHREAIAKANKKMPKPMYDVMNPVLNRSLYRKKLRAIETRLKLIFLNHLKLKNETK